MIFYDFLFLDPRVTIFAFGAAGSFSHNYVRPVQWKSPPLHVTYNYIGPIKRACE